MHCLDLCHREHTITDILIANEVRWWGRWLGCFYVHRIFLCFHQNVYIVPLRLYECVVVDLHYFQAVIWRVALNGGNRKWSVACGDYWEHADVCIVASWILGGQACVRLLCPDSLSSNFEPSCREGLCTLGGRNWSLDGWNWGQNKWWGCGGRTRHAEVLLTSNSMSVRSRWRRGASRSERRRTLDHEDLRLSCVEEEQPAVELWVVSEGANGGHRSQLGGGCGVEAGRWDAFTHRPCTNRWQAVNFGGNEAAFHVFCVQCRSGLL